jgi:dolichol-phosphate mannosyltransferase
VRNGELHRGRPLRLSNAASVSLEHREDAYVPAGPDELGICGRRPGSLARPEDRPVHTYGFLPHPAGYPPAMVASNAEVSIVVPVFNEGESIVPVMRALTAGITTPHEIVIVYDFDEDPTVPVIARLHLEAPGIRGLRNDLGRGVLNAMKAGIAASTGDYVLISMADGSDEPHVVDPMVALARAGADVVAASRYMNGGHQVGGPLVKRLMSRTAGLTLHWFGGVATHDPTNNFKLYSRRFLDATTIESSAGFELALELTVKATLEGRRVAEVPTTWRDRTAGASNFKLRKWLPHYLHWYWAAFRGRFNRRRAA